MDLKKLTNNDVDLNKIMVYKHNWKKNQRYSYVDNKRLDNGLMIVLRKGWIYYENNRKLQPEIGDILFLPKNSKYEVITEIDNASAILINFSISSFRTDCISLSDKIETVISKNKYIFESLFNEIWELSYNTVDNNIVLKLKLYEIIAKIIEFNSLESEMTPINKALSYINSELTTNLSIPEFSKICMMSESTFRREFKKETGKTPIEYINCEKIQKAKKMLVGENSSISKITEVLGFYDEAYFCKVFKKITGQTPNEYKKDCIH